MYQSKIQSQEDGKQKDFRCRCLYTDDTQLYLFIESSSLDQSVQITQSCMKGIDEWMTINNLKLNKSKTEFIITRSQHRPKTVLALGLEDVYSSNAADVIFHIQQIARI